MRVIAGSAPKCSHEHLTTTRVSSSSTTRTTADNGELHDRPCAGWRLASCGEDMQVLVLEADARRYRHEIVAAGRELGHTRPLRRDAGQRTVVGDLDVLTVNDGDRVRLRLRT